MGKCDTVALGELGTFQTGGTPTRSKPDYFRGTLPWITTTALGQKYIGADKASTFISPSALKESATKLIPEHSILIGARVGVGKVSINTIPICINQDIVAISNLDSKRVLPEYLQRYLETQKEHLNTQKRGATIQGIRIEVLKEMMIPVPPLPIQQKIAYALDKASALIEKRKAQIEKLDLLIKSQFIEMFGDLKDNPKRWSVTRLEEVIDFIEAGWSANGDARIKQYNEYGVLKVSAVTAGEFDESEYKVINEDIKKVIYPHKGDLLFSRANTRELVGATCIIRKDYPMLLLPDKLWRVRFNSEATCQYMKYLLSSKSIREGFSTESSGTSGSMYNISMKKFRSTLILLPPIKEQKEFSAFVDQVIEQKSLLHDSLAELEINYRSLMQKCFSGEMF